MKLLGIPPRFGIYPTALLEMGLPAHLIQTYIILYTLGWRTEYRTVRQTTEQLADLFSAIEGKEVQARGMRKRLQELADAGLVERSKRQGRWVTVLRLRHVTPTGSGAPHRVSSLGEVTPTGSVAPLEVTLPVPHLDKSIVAVVGDESVQQQQHDCSRSGTDVERNEELLREMGVVGSVVQRLAREEHVTAEYLEAVKAYREEEASRGNALGPGWVVKCVGEGWEIPDEKPDRYRYIQGRYKEWVRH